MDVSSNVMWKCLTLFISFSTVAQLVPQDNIVHVVELHNSTVSKEWAVGVGHADGEVVFVRVSRMFWLQSLGFCDGHIFSVTDTPLQMGADTIVIEFFKILFMNDRVQFIFKTFQIRMVQWWKMEPYLYLDHVHISFFDLHRDPQTDVFVSLHFCFSQIFNLHHLFYCWSLSLLMHQ